MNVETQPIQIIKPVSRQVDELADLVTIFDPGVQVCSFSRNLDADIIDFLEQSSTAGAFQVIENCGIQSELQLARLPSGRGRDVLLADLTLLKDIMIDLMGCPTVGLRMAQTDQAMCPGWHFDKTSIRLVCTYKGPGTQWVKNQDLNRHSLRSQNHQEQPFYQASEGEIVLLKGSLWQNNEAYGAIHRSPAVDASEGLRMVVTIDPLWND